MSEYDLAIYESPRAGDGPVFEVIELHGSSSGHTMLVHCSRSYDGALSVLRTRYPDAAGVAASGGGGQPGRWYFNHPRRPQVSEPRGCPTPGARSGTGEIKRLRVALASAAVSIIEVADRMQEVHNAEALQEIADKCQAVWDGKDWEDE